VVAHRKCVCVLFSVGDRGALRTDMILETCANLASTGVDGFSIEVLSSRFEFISERGLIESWAVVGSLLVGVSQLVRFEKASAWRFA